MMETQWIHAEAPAPVMYRTEGFSGEGYRDPAEVMSFETWELENADCAGFMLEHYLDPDSPLYARGCGIEEAALGGFIREQDPDEVMDFFGACLRVIEAQTGKRVTWCVWLATKETAVDFYGASEARFLKACGIETRGVVIDRYRTDGAVVLNDLGPEGMLLGFEGPREPDGSENATIDGEAQASPCLKKEETQ